VKSLDAGTNAEEAAKWASRMVQIVAILERLIIANVCIRIDDCGSQYEKYISGRDVSFSKDT